MHSLDQVLYPNISSECLEEIGRTIPAPPTSNTPDSGNKYRQIFKRKDVHLLAFFILLAVGVASTIGGMSLLFMFPSYTDQLSM